MGNPWKNWKLAFSIDADHYLVKNYRKKYHRHPHLTLLITSMLIGIIIICTFVWQMAGVHYQIFNGGKKDIFFDFFIWILATVVIFYLWLMMDNSCSHYVKQMTKLANCLDWAIDDLDRASESQLKSMAVNRLRLLASFIKEEEKVAKEYWPELARMRFRFKNTYDTFVQAGLIQDAGYRFYFEDKKN